MVRIAHAPPRRQARVPYFEHTEPLASRIATGLHEIGLAMKQHAWQQANQEGLSRHPGSDPRGARNARRAYGIRA